MTIIIFTMNGVTNDYFVSIFFMTTSICGLVYLSKAGYNMPDPPVSEGSTDQDYINQVLTLKYKIEKDIVMKEMDTAFWRTLGIAALMFLGSIACIHYNVAVFGMDHDQTPEIPHKITTMGTSAAIMILGNIVSWPSILEGIRAQKPLRKERSHMKRA